MNPSGAGQPAGMRKRFMQSHHSTGFHVNPKRTVGGFAVPLVVLLLAACVLEHPQTAGQRAAEIAASLAAGASMSSVGEAGAVCGDASPNGGVEALATRELDALRFAWRVRCVRRVAQRPATLRIDEIEEIVAWRDGNRANARRAEAVFIAVSHGPPSDTADARGVWPLAAVLAALEAHVEDQDSVSRSVVLTLGAVPSWDILDASVPDDTVPSALDSEYRNLLEATADSGPSPPLARPRQPGILIGLIPQSDLPILSHDPRNRQPTEGSVFGHNAWKVPDGVSLRTSGDMLVLGLADGVSADDDAVLSELTGVVVRALKAVHGWTGLESPAISLPWDWQTISWLLGIVLPIVLLGVGTWCLLCGSLTNLGNARRALRYTDAEVARHLLWWRRTVRRTRRRIVRSKRRRHRTAERIERLGRILRADDGSARRTARARAGLRQAEHRRHMLDGRLAELEKALETARGESDMAETALWAFARAERHRRDSDDRRPEDSGGASEPDGSVYPTAGGVEWREAINRVLLATRPTRRWLWVRRVLHRPRAHTAGHPRDRKPEFVDRMTILASCLVCYRQWCEETRYIHKQRGQDMVSGVWNGVWRTITTSQGARAFAIGAGSVIAALVLARFAMQLATLESIPALRTTVKLVPFVVVAGAYWWFRGYEDGRAVVWGAAALTMLGLTTIEFTALDAHLKDVFDSQRVTVMQLVIVAMLFIGQEFGIRAAIGRRRELRDDQEEFAELLKEAKRDLSKCLGKVSRLEGVSGVPCDDFKDSVTQAGARFANPRNRERRVVLIVTALYFAVCVHFVAPALSWQCCWLPTGVRVQGDALNIVVIAAAVVFLPLFSLWRAWNAAAKSSSETMGRPCG